MPKPRRTSLTGKLFDFLLLCPVWVGPVAAIGAYVCLRYVVPAMLAPASPDPLTKSLGMVFATFSRDGALLVAILVAGIWLVAEVQKWRRRRLLDKQDGIESLRGLSWAEFEALVGEAFRRQGYLVEETGSAAGDGGVDLVLARGGKTVLVQCKQWKAWKVGVRPVRELYGVVAARKACEGIVVTSGLFTQDAQNFARNLPLRLIDGPALAALVAGVQRPAKTPRTSGSGAVVFTPAPPQAPSAPSCPRCGAPMVQRVARKGSLAGKPFWGCSKYPQCRGTCHIAD